MHRRRPRRKIQSDNQHDWINQLAHGCDRQYNQWTRRDYYNADCMARLGYIPPMPKRLRVKNRNPGPVGRGMRHWH